MRHPRIFLALALLCASACAAKQPAKTAILGKWKHVEAGTTLEFTDAGKYTITDKDGVVTKSGGYKVLDEDKMQWEHLERWPNGTSTIEMIDRTIKISGNELVISGDDGESRWRR